MNWLIIKNQFLFWNSLGQTFSRLDKNIHICRSLFEISIFIFLKTILRIK